ncbi:MAG TPA: molybdopterin biosynthesis protein [Syntrophorhabdaceae bacterium]|nr:molybdopterin biosynthesis protein [Syntrophorhabdaceae bacterium]
MKRYLETIKREEAIKVISSFASPIEEEETIPTWDSVGRITSRAVYARFSSPAFICAAMDGYAVDFKDTLDADVNNPLTISKNNAFYVNTGDPLPKGTNAVIMIEDIEELSSSIIIRRPVYLWQNIRMIGEDIIESDMVIPKNHLITPYDMGMIISAGIKEINVRRRPRLLIIPTGKELIDIFDKNGILLKKGHLIDFNSYTIMKLAQKIGFETKRHGIIREKKELEEIFNNLIEEFDVIIINAGTSSGTEDYTEEIIRKKGKIIFHGVSMMPGKPTIFGIVKEKFVFGIPGYPVSATLSFKMFLEPLYERLTGVKRFYEEEEVITAFKIPSRIGIEEIIRVNIVSKDNSYFAIPLPRGASIFSSMARADGLIFIPENVEGFDEGEKIKCTLLKSRPYLKKRINLIGSHDIVLDILRDMIRERYSEYDFMATPTGSLSGIIALKRGITSLCTTHILDEVEKIYNIPLIKKYLNDTPCILINLAKRIQGLIVQKGNPKRIKGIEDLIREDIVFVNRQFGSGTRILFDTILKEKGIKKLDIKGYDREEASHTAVAIMVKESIADVAMGIFSVAKIFSLDFIPLGEEDFDLLVSKDFYHDEKFKMLMEIIESDEFKQRLLYIGGYKVSDTGKIKFEQ